MDMCIGVGIVGRRSRGYCGLGLMLDRYDEGIA